VIRKHATMLTDAGVDVIIFDTTNGYTYQDTYRLLLDTFADIRAQGENTPQIAFLTPFGTPRQVVVDLYQNLYQPGIHPELWFHWEGKPLILADPALLTPAMLIGQGSDPSPLDSGHAQGQTFTATAPLMGVGAQVPTWATSTSAMTLFPVPGRSRRSAGRPPTLRQRRGQLGGGVDARRARARRPVLPRAVRPVRAHRLVDQHLRRLRRR